jgi:hypothetical protein
MKQNENYYVLKLIGFLFFFYSCNQSSTKSTKKNFLESDTIVFQVDDKPIHFMLFDYVKANPYAKVYIFQEEKIDDYGNSQWVNWWLINDFTIQEYNEMRKYANYSWYLEKVLKGNNRDNRKFTLINIRNK